MTSMKTTLAAAAMSLAALSAHAAGNTGLSVTGSLAFGTNGENGGQYWDQEQAIIGSGVEYFYIDSANQDIADFDDSFLTISDDVFSNANGWKMTFSTPDGFKSLSLVSSNFAPGLTYSLNGGVIEINWTGTMEAGAYTAVFNVSAVPEPSAYALTLAGLLTAGAVARRRRRA